MTRSARRLLLGMFLGIAVFAGFMLYLEAGEAGNLRARLSGFAWWSFAAALGLALVNYVVRFVRWELYLARRDIEVPRATSLAVFISGFGFAITPGKVGELVKSYLLRHLRGVPMARSASIVVAERVTDLLALLMLAVLGVALYGVARTTVVAGLAVVGVGLVVLATPPLTRALIDAVTYPQALRRLRGRLHVFYSGLSDLVRPRPLTWGTGFALLAWLAECLGFALVANGFEGVSVPFGLAILIYATTTVAGALSFLPGGLLVTEATMTLLLIESSSGFDQAGAVAATFLIRLATLWFAVALGLGALLLLRLRHRGIGAAIEPSGGSDGNRAADE